LSKSEIRKIIAGKEVAKFGPKIFWKIDAGQSLVQTKGCKEEGTLEDMRKGARPADHYDG
jgi:hypothetical protein